MKQNKYDDVVFFEKYLQMDRSTQGLAGAGEWHALQNMLPCFQGKRVLDLGCGLGWHCQYAVEQGAAQVVGVDISSKMLAVAKKQTNSRKIKYVCSALEDIEFPQESFDVVISSLTLHYVSSFADICNKIYHLLAPQGVFIFSVEHPIFTAQGSQQWVTNEQGKNLHWPVDHYFTEGLRESIFLGEAVQKQHRTLATYLNTLLQTGFQITGMHEPQPTPEMLAQIPAMRDELRRPMMMLISVSKT